MGANCCCFRKGSITRSPDRNEPASCARKEIGGDDVRPSEPTLPSPTIRPSIVGDIMESVSFVSLGESSNALVQESEPRVSLVETSDPRETPSNFAQECASQGDSSNTRETPENHVRESAPSLSLGEASRTIEPPRNIDEDERLCYIASNILWTTGSFSDPIPNAFYSVIPDDRLEYFESIPTLDVLREMGKNGLKADVILVDLEEDNRVKRMKNLINRIARINSTPNKVKKIAEVVLGAHNKNSSVNSPQKARQSFKSYDIPKLGQIKHASCHSRAMWFKVLADSVGLESTLVVGLPSDMRPSANVESFSHMSVVVVINTVRWLVDLTLSPGRLVPLTARKLYMAHIAAPGDSSCALPFKPNSPMYSDHERALRVRRRSLNNKQKNVSSFHLGDANDQDGNDSQSLESNEPPHQAISKIWNRVFKDKPLSEDCYIDFSDLGVGAYAGSGCFGRVFHGIWNGTDVAVKTFLRQDSAEHIKDFCNEIFILSRLQHPNVIKFLGVCTEPPQLSLITEYMERGSLYDVIRSNGHNLSWSMKLKMLRDICKGLKYIHEMGIFHRDLKSANCLLADDWTVKICDFGLSRMMDDTTDKGIVVGTAQWIAPEVILKEPFTEKSDIFSFGVVMWELCTLSEPWKYFPAKAILAAVAFKGARLAIPKGPLSKLIADCWSKPEQRPSCDEILAYLETCEDAETEQTPS